MLGNNF